MGTYIHYVQKYSDSKFICYKGHPLLSQVFSATMACMIFTEKKRTGHWSQATTPRAKHQLVGDMPSNALQCPPALGC